jgi:hypothetical protein
VFGVRRGQPHLPTLLAAITALIIAVTGLVTALGNATSNQHIVNRAQGNLKKRAVQAAVSAANTTAVTNCDPALGAAQLGACAPVQAATTAGALAKAAGDPFDIRGELGVDVSSYQPCGVTGPQFSVYKATESTGYTDRCAASNVAASKRAHKPYAMYDFLRPGSSTPEQEAAHFVAVVNAVGGNTSLPPVADVEVNTHAMSPVSMLDYVCRWHRAVQRGLHRSTSITYTGYYFWQDQVAAGSCGTKLWVAAYASQAYTPHGFDHKTAWQYSNGQVGPTPHINGWDSDVWLGKGPESLEALSNQAPVAPKEASHQCRMHNHYAKWYSTYKARFKEKGHLGEFGAKRLGSAEEHLRKIRRYFVKNHEHGKTNYDCLTNGTVRVRVL